MDSDSPEENRPDSGAVLPELLAERYRLGKELGRGGMATVYLGRDEKHGARRRDQGDETQRGMTYLGLGDTPRLSPRWSARPTRRSSG